MDETIVDTEEVYNDNVSEDDEPDVDIENQESIGPFEEDSDKDESEDEESDNEKELDLESVDMVSTKSYHSLASVQTELRRRVSGIRRPSVIRKKSSRSIQSDNVSVSTTISTKSKKSNGSRKEIYRPVSLKFCNRNVILTR